MVQILATRSRRRVVAARGRTALNGFLALTLVAMMAAVAAVGARPAPTGAQDAALETASVVPETVLLYAAVNFDTTSDQFAQSVALWERTGLGELLASQNEDEPLISAEDAADVAPFLGGEVAVVVTSIPSSDDLPLEGLTGGLTGGVDAATAVAEMTDAASAEGVAAIILAPDPDAAFAKAEELLAETASESGNEVTTSDYGGVEISSVAGSEDGTSDPAAIARVGDFVLLAAKPGDIAPIVDVEGGRTPALADSDSFSTLRGELSDEFMLWAYVNGPGLKEGITADVTSDDLESLEFFLGSGLSAFDAYTGVVVFAAPNGFRLDTISIPTTDAPSPISETFDPTFDERVAGDTLLFLNGVNLGTNPILRAVALAIAQDENGEEAGTIPEGADPVEYAAEQFEQAAQSIGFNLQTDLLDHLSGEFVLALSISSLLGPDGIGGVFATTVDDAAVVTDVVSTVAAMIADQLGATTDGTPASDGTTTVSTRQIGDDTVNVIEDSSTGIPLTIEYGVVGDQLVVGLGSGLQKFLDGPAQPLADSPRYQAAMGELPAEHGASAYVDLGQVIAIAQFFLASSFSEGTSFEDASPDCEEYESRDEAQAAYDADPGTLIDLDQDFDGEACDDFAFEGEATPVPAGGDISAIQALATVFFERDELRGSSTILYIPE